MSDLGKYNLVDGQLTAANTRTRIKNFFRRLKPSVRRQEKFLGEARHLAHERKAYLVIQVDSASDLVAISKKDKVVILQMSKGYAKKAVRYNHERFADYLLQAIDTGIKSLAGKE